MSRANESLQSRLCSIQTQSRNNTQVQSLHPSKAGRQLNAPRKKQKEQEAVAGVRCVAPQQQFEDYQLRKQHHLCEPTAVEIFIGLSEL